MDRYWIRVRENSAGSEPRRLLTHRRREPSETVPRNTRMIGRMKSLKNGAATLLKLLGVAVVLALIMLLVEVVAGIFLLAADALFGL